MARQVLRFHPVGSGYIYWRSGNGGVCSTATNNLLIVDRVDSCNSISVGSFAGANSAVFLGFLNFLLWTTNLWFLYKETSWFGGGKQLHETDAVRIEENPMESKSEDN